MDFVIVVFSLILSSLLMFLTSRLRSQLSDGGKPIFKLKSFDVVLFKPAAFILPIFGLVNVLWKPTMNAGLIFIVITVMSWYAYWIAKASESAILEKGVLIVEGFPVLLEWKDIDKFNLHKQRIFFESKGKYYSIKLYNSQMEMVEAHLKRYIHV